MMDREENGGFIQRRTEHDGLGALSWREKKVMVGDAWGRRLVLL